MAHSMNAGNRKEQRIGHRGRRLVRLALLGWLAACGTASENDADSVSTAHEAVVQSISLPISLPVGASIQRLAVGAGNTLEFRDRVSVAGPSAATGGVTAGNETKLRDITAKGNIKLGDRSKVTGNLKAGGTLTVPSSATVTGTRQSGVNMGAAVVTHLNFQADSVSSGPVAVAQDQARDLPPGTYSSLNMMARARVTLHTGTYLFKGALVLEPGSILAVDSARGPVEVYFQGNLTFRGKVAPATVGVPQLLLGKLGSGTALLDASFTGALLAPQADIALQAARPNGHRAVIYGKTVRLEADTVVHNYRLDWEGVDPALRVPLNPDDPVVSLPESPIQLPVGVDASGEGTKDASVETGSPVTFSLPERYPVEGGIIGNGAVRFTFKTPSGQTVACTYRGGSSTATPATPAELNLGRVLLYQGCSDGLPRATPRTGDSFTLHVDPIPGYPVQIGPPVTSDNSCSENFELLTPEKTTQMRESFSWAGKTLVPTTNGDGSPTLFYAWVLVRTQADVLNLQKLFIHTLSRPLFLHELEAFSGRCGMFTNPGDGYGSFVPVLIPGATYNRLIQALTSADVGGDKVIFDAVILRNDEVPAAVRNANGSVQLQALARARFQYLPYEPRPLADKGVALDGGGVAKALVDVVTWVADAANNAAEFVTNRLNELDRALFRETVSLNLHLHALNLDPAFASAPDSIALRGWGQHRGQPLAARGLQVTILQQLLDTFIPTTAQGLTDINGQVTIDATAGGDLRGKSGFCVELTNDAVRVSTGLVRTEICDFTTRAGQIVTLGSELPSSDHSVRLKVASPNLNAVYQMDDAFQWSKDVMGFTPQRARVLAGYWADTFSPKSLPYAPCVSVAGAFGLSDAIIAASWTGGVLANIAGTYLAGSQAAGSIASTFGTLMSQTDIVMPNNSSIRNNRLVMSHEYGHFILCSMLDKEDAQAVNEIVYSTIATGDDLRVAGRFVNEAFADFIAGQVTGGVNHTSLNGVNKLSGASYCIPSLQPCMDENYRERSTAADSRQDNRSISRMISLFHDVFDGHGQPLGSHVPGDGDLWDTADTSPDSDFSDDFLVPYGLPSNVPVYGYGNYDGDRDHIALRGEAMLVFTEQLAIHLDRFGSSSLTDSSFYVWLDEAIRQNSSASWCDRCQLFALHSPGFCPDPSAPGCHDPSDADSSPEFRPSVRALLDECINNTFIAGVLAAHGPPPEPAGRLDSASCLPCSAGKISNDAGQCVACNGVVHGNVCDPCAADVVMDGYDMDIVSGHSFDPTAAVVGDACTEIFWVQINNPQAIFARGGTLAVEAGPVAPPTQANCVRGFELLISRDTGNGFSIPETLQGTGSVLCPTSSCTCAGTPARIYTATDVADGRPLRFGLAANDPTRRLFVGPTSADPR